MFLYNNMILHNNIVFDNDIIDLRLELRFALRFFAAAKLWAILTVLKLWMGYEPWLARLQARQPSRVDNSIVIKNNIVINIFWVANI